MAYSSQTNTITGKFQRIASQDLTGKEGCLAKLVTSAGGVLGEDISQVALAGVGDRALYIILDGDIAGNYVTIEPLTGAKNFRVPNTATLACGAAVECAANGTVRALTTNPRVGFMEENGVSGQNVLIRPAIL